MKPKAPNGLDIVGALNHDGSVRDVKLNVGAGPLFDWVLGASASPVVEPLVLVDSANGTWAVDEVEEQALRG